MQDYYSLYTWALDRQSEMLQQAADRRMLRRSRNAQWVLQWPIARRQAAVNHEHPRHPARRAA